MTKTTEATIVDVLVSEHGRLLREEAGIDAPDGSPDALFGVLVAAFLSRPPADFEAGLQAARTLHARGFTTAYDYVRATRDEIAAVLADEGFERADEDTAVRLAELAVETHERYQGDLNRLRDEALEDRERERELLKQLPAVGDSTVDLFFAEIQRWWDEIEPFVPDDAVTAARSLNIGDGVEDLPRFVDPDDFPRLVMGLVRAQRTKSHTDVLAQAQRGKKRGYNKQQEGSAR